MKETQHEQNAKLQGK